jgi:hypothetical protein
MRHFLINVPFTSATLEGDFTTAPSMPPTTSSGAKNPGGIYTPGDYNIWRANFGRTFFTDGGSGALSSASASAEPQSAAVPEPATLVMLKFAAAGWCLRRRRAA